MVEISILSRNVLFPRLLVLLNTNWNLLFAGTNFDTSTHSVLHCEAALGAKPTVSEAGKVIGKFLSTVVRSSPHFLYTLLKVLPQSVVSNTSSVSSGVPVLPGNLAVACARSNFR